MKRFGMMMSLVLVCSSQAALAKNLNVVASFTVLADMAKQVGGEHVTVKSLVGPDGDPHSFEPSPQDSVALSKADVVIVSGLGMEGWMDRLVSASGYKGKVIVASEGISTRKMIDDGKQITDPHAWNSAENGAIYAQNITKALVAADPQDAAAINDRGSEYVTRLKLLDSWAKTRFEAIAKSKRKVLTSHDAFGYFGQEYGVTFLAPVGFSTEAEANASDVAGLIKQLKDQHIKTYFIENQTDPRLVKQIAAASDAQPGGELYPEALSAANGPASTYEMAFKHNVDTIANSMK
ncbi:metal ABC transporter substrate-binding protein [Buttiauxella noackiae]|uniref:Periplasmic substrate-binding component of an ABC superfamily zinc transporter n=1 Tax=Buttiauxella noackiae ATCC 51607 TaxID=1354255 RepID=A0A1B7HLR4_9ENTR|nr:metal ABC transporter substrate-binding protein [Buttiauxella noackiae]MCA1923660.1 metal ABC transporter substrate-binding protein [Buttiauxella noackiae]OAT16573.1 periplasmic substrate-binding component of an ABC superfamily zinc transporter [Buttiauxella noackiae ATCC 51607]